MSQLNTNKLLILILWCLFLLKLFAAADCNGQGCCNTSRLQWTADCDRMKMREFPKYLAYYTRKLKLSYNLIQNVNKEDLERYPYMVHLHLMDNRIVNLDDDVFQKSTSLTTVDLSANALKKVPPSLFQLPHLRILYLSENRNLDVAESIDEAKPISRSCLTMLDISYITEDGNSTDFPDFGQLPLLSFLNITGVNFKFISPRHFCGLCSLKTLVSRNVSAKFKDPCDCYIINRWLLKRKVKFTKFECPKTGIDCSNKPIDVEDLKVYHNCRVKYATTLRSLFIEKLWRVVITIFVLMATVIGFPMAEHVMQRRELLARELRLSLEHSRQRINRELLNN